VDTLSGSVERIAFYNSENGYTVLQLLPGTSSKKTKLHGANRGGLVTVVGNLPQVTPGENLQLQGRWVVHPKHGDQFLAEICKVTVPATITGIQRYLGSGLVKGIGPALAERIVTYFGTEALDIIEDSPHRLREVPDIGPKRTTKIVQAWCEQREVKEIMLFLHSHGVTTNLAVKIYKTYGDNALAVVWGDPYALARDIYGVGFKTADKIAQDMGLARDHPSRIEAGVIYVLNGMSREGHVYLPKEILTRQAIELLVVDPGMIQPALDRLSQEDRVQPDDLPISSGFKPKGNDAPGVSELNGAIGRPVIYLTPFYFAEVGAAERLGSLANTIPSRLLDIPPAFISIDPGISDEQAEAIRTVLSHPVSVLTGGPGTGKTTCLKELITILESSSKRYALASPTGRAAKRLAEATDRPASTIHRLLGYSPVEGFKVNAENPLPIDCLIVDETSMLDLILANNLFKALEPGTHLLLVGDVDQLPSVGAGDVLRDVIASGIAAVVRLHTIYRQAADSHIITNAHRINQGEFPQFSSSTPDPSRVDTLLQQVIQQHKEGGDFFLFPAEDAISAADWIVDVVTERIPKKFGFDPIRDIQVLAPMYKGASGVNALNEQLQDRLNPFGNKKKEIVLFGVIYRPGDKVMQIRNNYGKDVFNGDIGFISSIDLVEHSLIVVIDDRVVTYDFAEADQLVLAYAVTVHKAQGSEFAVVVIPVITAHFIMLQRNLLYTAITRAKNLCVLVGNRKAIGIAVRNNKVSQRYSALDWRLQNLH
jgi:exodeoxyribonuclease V alpha subunit